MAALEIQSNVGLISNDPGIVPWWEQLSVTRTDFALRAIIHAHMQATRKTVVKMRHLATLRASCRFHVL